ncbi:retropepsin-like domain-containing protein, partial [Salmonella enterica]|nr:retropepsin-like domain-containing protein [Salmonella enterica]
AVPQEQVLMEIRNTGLLKFPGRMKSSADRRDKSQYCLFHRDHGHSTRNCIQLKDEIEALIQNGYLKEFVGEPRAEADQGWPRPSLTKDGRDKEEPLREIRTIFGGPAGGGSSRKRKAMVREARSEPEYRGMYSVHLSKAHPPLEFTEAEAASIHQPHNDALVVTLIVANVKIHRILIDGGSSADVLSLTAFKAMRLGRELLKPSLTPLVGFGGERVTPEGSIELPVTFGDGQNAVTKMINFLVVDCMSAYNPILGRPTLHEMKAIASTYHQLLKFPTPNGVGVVKGEQKESRECYWTALKAVKPQRAEADQRMSQGRAAHTSTNTESELMEF